MIVECGINEMSTRVIVREERNNRNIFRTPLLVIKVLDRNANKFNDYEIKYDFMRYTFYSVGITNKENA